ncbi:hypothetical protein FDP41_011545 [Naegleria fowleri]|uniref:Uncharacterized protein n=1 Tax=Naegleria fowleri TaxID=5763 RepID=A0A6A5CB84_NAEFO|nr:uncharacterized protein FDP41_011545 [Naegleria fowleri]KAF0982615.1 hypothetical protein FDP41_011545 [Naegleria fowleri]
MATEDHNNNSTSIMLDEGSAILDSGGVFHDTHGLTHSSSATTPETSSNSTSTNESARRKRASSSASSTSTRRTSKTKKKKNQEQQDDESSPEEDTLSNENQESSLSHNRALLPNQRTACPMEEVPNNQQGRYWIFEMPPNAEPLNDVVVRVTMKIRGEEARNYVPEKLYSSHKYVIMHEISGKSLVEKYPLIVSKIHVINPATREELKNSKNSSKLCLMGTMETALTKLAGSNGKKTKETSSSSEDVVKGQMKVQFTDVSYHHEKGHFGFIIHYFNPANLETPLFSLIAPPFNVFARKPTNENQTETLQPTKPKPSKRKRKSDMENEADNVSSSALEASTTATSSAEASHAAGDATSTTAVVSPSKKKTRRPKKPQKSTSSEEAQQASSYTVPVASTQPSQNLLEFNKKLEAIVNIKKQLGQDASKRASELALQNLITLDTFASHDFVLSNTQTNGGQQILSSTDATSINPATTNSSGL